MRAVQINNYGLEALEIKNLSDPTEAEGKIVVEVKAASINVFDVKVLTGAYKSMMPLNFPNTPGGDFSGIVKKTGDQITNLKVGDEVFGTAGVFSGGSGSFAEMALVKATSTAQRPKNISFQESAALPLVGSSAVQALEEHMKLQSGQKILIHGGAGGIGHVAIQVAKAIGAYVVTTVSAEDFEFVKHLGADEVLNYKQDNFAEKLRDLDAVYDTVGGEITNKSIKVLKSGGILVSMINEADVSLTEKAKITAIRQGTKNNTRHLQRIKELVELGRLKVNIDKTFTLDEIKEAFTHQMQNHPKGKVVIKIKD